MKIPNEIIITKEQIKIGIAIIIFFGLLWLIPNIICLIDTGEFCREEYKSDSSGFFGDE